MRLRHIVQEIAMTTLEAVKTDNSVTAPHKAFVVKSGAGYRAEQGSDYEPGVSAETVGSKSIWLGMITLPKADSCIATNGLFDHLVANLQKCVSKWQPERFGLLDIDDKFKLIRRLSRQIASRLTLEDTINI